MAVALASCVRQHSAHSTCEHAVRNTPSVPGPGRLASIILFAAAMFATSCSRLHRGDDDREPAILLFENQSLDQADIFVSRGVGDNRRIGTVQAGRTESLVIPQEMVAAGSINIIARLLARSFAPRTGAVAVNPGDRIRVTLPSDERQLTVLPAPAP
jgi:hypothetical protein